MSISSPYPIIERFCRLTVAVGLFAAAFLKLIDGPLSSQVGPGEVVLAFLAIGLEVATAFFLLTRRLIGLVLLLVFAAGVSANAVIGWHEACGCLGHDRPLGSPERLTLGGCLGLVATTCLLMGPRSFGWDRRQ